jgi:hypothetical protein
MAMASEPKKYQVIVASDVLERDGIGVEIYDDDEMIAEVFRDDTKKTRTVWLKHDRMPLEAIEKIIAIFKKEIPWDFINYDTPIPDDDKNQ